VQYEHQFETCCACGFVRMADPPPDAVVMAEYEVDRSHGETIWEHHDQFLGIFDAILARIERHLGGAKGRLLDVGCSYGNALLAARARGWEVAGIELSRPAVEYGVQSYGLDIRMAELQRAGFEPASFDAILMHHVLEHVLEPDVLVQQVRALLRPGGVHYQALPNWRCLKRFLLGSC
jgi:2-polyprenyl-3-methyl-5-hydroxy-6-metoxy-1,4-benzoquinol methylase